MNSRERARASAQAGEGLDAPFTTDEQEAGRAADHGAVVPVPRRRGDRQRQAIVQAVRELLEERPFAQLSVSTISDRAGVARSGFYFYFDSKYAVLAQNSKK